MCTDMHTHTCTCIYFLSLSLSFSLPQPDFVTFFPQSETFKGFQPLQGKQWQVTQRFLGLSRLRQHSPLPLTATAHPGCPPRAPCTPFVNAHCLVLQSAMTALAFAGYWKERRKGIQPDPTLSWPLLSMDLRGRSILEASEKGITVEISQPRKLSHLRVKSSRPYFQRAFNTRDLRISGSCSLVQWSSNIFDCLSHL